MVKLRMVNDRFLLTVGVSGLAIIVAGLRVLEDNEGVMMKQEELSALRALRQELERQLSEYTKETNA